MKYFLGMDVGGTKTLCLVGDARGRIVGFGKGGCGSYEYHGFEHAARENEHVLQEALDSAGIALREVEAIGLGVAGADVPGDFEILEERVYTPLFGELPRTFRNDSMAALRGGTDNPYGIVIVCGTGSVCAGRNPNGVETRVGGLGPEFGDRCTGPMLAREALLAVWRARDEIIEPTGLTEKFLERTGCADVESLFEGVYGGHIEPEQIEGATELIFEAAVDGDRVACDILRDGGRYLGAMVNAVAKRLAMTEAAFDVVMAGGVFRGRAANLVDALEAKVAPVCAQARFRVPLYEPVVGALLMAYDMEENGTQKLLSIADGEVAQAEKRYEIQLKAS